MAPIFLINIVLGTAGFVGALRFLPHDIPDAEVVIDGLGAGLLGASMLGLMYGLVEGSTAGWTWCRSSAWPSGRAFGASACARAPRRTR